MCNNNNTILRISTVLMGVTILSSSLKHFFPRGRGRNVAFQPSNEIKELIYKLNEIKELIYKLGKKINLSESVISEHLEHWGRSEEGFWIFGAWNQKSLRPQLFLRLMSQKRHRRFSFSPSYLRYVPRCPQRGQEHGTKVLRSSEAKRRNGYEGILAKIPLATLEHGTYGIFGTS